MSGSLKAFEFLDHLESQLSWGRELIDIARSSPYTDEIKIQDVERQIDDLESRIIDISEDELIMPRISELNGLSGNLHDQLLSLGRIVLR